MGNMGFEDAFGQVLRNLREDKEYTELLNNIEATKEGIMTNYTNEQFLNLLHLINIKEYKTYKEIWNYENVLNNNILR